jgi:hypothetical protein
MVAFEGDAVSFAEITLVFALFVYQTSPVDLVRFWADPYGAGFGQTGCSPVPGYF